MNKIKQAFENFWEVYQIGKRFKEKDKKEIYQVFLDGYGCAFIDLENSHKKTGFTPEKAKRFWDGDSQREQKENKK